MDEATQIKENFSSVFADIERAALEVGRDAGDVQLVAVSKRQAVSKIEAALLQGQRVFGENKVQEAQAHWADKRSEYPDLRLHLIGPLQTNKVKDAVALFDVIETVDRPKLAKALQKEMAKQERFLPVLIQVNIGAEPQKAGVSIEDLPEFVEYCSKECGLDVRGLMCIPPQDEPAALYFALMKKIGGQLDLPWLSMGMSADYEQAIALGAHYVRVGTRLFGTREN